MNAAHRISRRVELPDFGRTNDSSRNRGLSSNYSAGEGSGKGLSGGTKRSNKSDKVLSMDIESFDDDLPNVRKYKQKHDMLPDKNFRMLIIGGSGCGKTTLLLNLIMKFIHWDRLYVYAKTVGDDQDKYVILEEFVQGLEERVAEEADKVTLGTFSTKLSDLVKVDDLDPKKQNLIVFDDIVLEKDQLTILDHMIRGRKKNCSYIYLTQSYFKVPKTVRLNMSQFVLFRIESQKELRQIADDHASRIDFKQFMELYRIAVKDSDPFSFLYIDTDAKNIHEYLRRGFTECYFPDTNDINATSKGGRVRH